MAIIPFKGLVAELGQLLNMTDRSANEDDYVGLLIDGHELHIQYEAGEDAVMLFTRLQEAEPECRAAVHSLLLGANLCWLGTGGATFSIDFNTGWIFLMDRRALGDLEPGEAAGWIERFVSTAAYWRARIEAVNDGGPLGTPDVLAEAAPIGGLSSPPPGGTLA